MKYLLSRQHEWHATKGTRICIASGLIVLVTFAMSSVVFGQSKARVGANKYAAPSVQSPEGEFPPIFAEHRLAISKCQALCANVSSQLTTIETKLAKAPPKRADFENISQVYPSIWLLRHRGEQLRLMKEPAGDNILLRASEFTVRIDRLNKLCREQPYFSEWYGQMRRNTTNPEVLRRNLMRAGKRGTPELAEEAILKLFSNELRYHFWIPYAESVKEIGDLLAAGTKMRGIMKSRIEAATDGLARKALEETSIDYVKLRGQLANVVAAVGNSGKGDWEGTILTGPKAVGKIGESWEKTRILTIRNRTLANTFPRLPNSSTTKFDDFTGEVINQLGALVEKDANRVSGQDAPALYQEYLEAFAGWNHRFGEALTAAIEPGLQQLADNEPDFAANVKHYRYIADDVLRWQARIALKKSSNVRGASRSVEDIISETATPKAGVFTGLNLTAGGLQKLALASSTAKFLPEVSQRLSNDSVLLTDLNGMPYGNIHFSIQPYQQRHYARARINPSVLENATTQLRNTITPHVGETVLSLKMATALAETARGDISALGGKMSSYGLESIIVRFATISNGLKPLLMSGPIPPGEISSSGVPVLVVLDVEPAWLQGEYYFVELN